MDTGTGAVHTAPAHGADDFDTGVKYGLDLHCDVDEGGILRNGLPEYEGQQVFKANPLIVELLKSRGVLLGFEKIEHSYPHCWRCHNPIIFRATEQWFISMEGKLPGGTLRSRALEEIKKVKWDPAWGEERISNMVATRPDWCISRQRIWGVPIAVFQCEGCKEFLNDPAVNRAVVELFAREGADAWYKHSAEEILPAGTKCAKCGGTKFRKEMDIIDVWFESGSSQAAVLGHEPGLPWPADLYLEGGDQHRGWFQSSLLCAVATKGAAPYRSAATAGWTLDPQGRAMSKSLGNTVDPVEIADKLGAEIVRLWVASVDFREDVMASDELMQRIAESYRKIRNTFRYILGNLSDFDPAQRRGRLRRDASARSVLPAARRRSHAGCARALRRFCLPPALPPAERFLHRGPERDLLRRAQGPAVHLGAEIAGPPLGPDRAVAAGRGVGAAAGSGHELHRGGGLGISCRPSIASRERACDAVPSAAELTGTIPSGFDVAALESDWDTLLTVRNEALKVLEIARAEKTIGGSLEAQLHVAAPAQLFPVLERHRDQLRYLFIVSDVVLEKSSASNGDTGLTITVNRAPGQKCERCWNYSIHVGEDQAYPTVCERCSAVLSEIEATASAR